MGEKEIVYTIPDDLYEKLKEAQAEYAIGSLEEFTRQAVEEKLEALQRKAYLRKLRALQDAVQQAGGAKSMGLGETKEEIIDNLRKVRQQIFEEEYAHLYSTLAIFE